MTKVNMKNLKMTQDDLSLLSGLGVALHYRRLLLGMTLCVCGHTFKQHGDFQLDCLGDLGYCPCNRAHLRLEVER